MGETTTVLVLEDTVYVRRALVRLLSARGHEVAPACSCADALAQEGTFDAVVLDIDLGEGDGVEIAATLLRHGKIARVIFYTGVGDDARITRAAALGTVVTKGEGIESLLGALR